MASTKLEIDEAARAAEQIDVLRSELDRLNLELLRTLEARGSRVLEIMALKAKLDWPAYDPGREREMIEALVAQANGAYSKDALERIFGAIFAASRALRPRK